MNKGMSRWEYNLTRKEGDLLNIGRKQGALKELYNIEELWKENPNGILDYIYKRIKELEEGVEK